MDDPAQVFDPAVWLAAFEGVGGWYVITGCNDVNVGWRVFGSDDGAQLKARALYAEIEHDTDRRHQVRNFILKTQRGLSLEPD